MERALLALIEGMPSVSLEPMLAIRMDEVMINETAAETNTDKDVLREATADRL